MNDDYGLVNPNFYNLDDGWDNGYVPNQYVLLVTDYILKCIGSDMIVKKIVAHAPLSNNQSGGMYIESFNSPNFRIVINNNGKLYFYDVDDKRNIKKCYECSNEYELVNLLKSYYL